MTRRSACAESIRSGRRALATRNFGAGVRVPVFRYHNDSDLVPHLPLGLLFRHVGQLQFIDGAGHLHRDLARAVEMMLDPGAHLISAKESLTMQAQIRGGSGFELPVAGFLADHAPQLQHPGVELLRPRLNVGGRR